MDDSLYDEFGNYVGPELSGDESDGSEGDSGAGGSSDEDGSGMDLDAAEAAADARLAAGDADQQPGQHLVLHEDKKYYPSAEEVYGEGVETLVEDEDAQPLETPIIAPPKDPKLGAAARDALPTKYPVDFMVNLMNTPELVRNVAVVGHLHAGKTVLMDNLVTQTHDTRGHPAPARDAQMRYTDTRVDEQLREISIKSAPMSLVLESAKGKSHLFNLVDTPGHPNFSDEVTAALQLTDGVLLCVDAVEGVMLGTEHVIRQALLQNVAITLCITKMDRLITELKLPPADAYFKLRHLIDEVNKQIETFGGAPDTLSPLRGNVAFSSALFRFSFTLDSYAQLYCDVQHAVFDPRDFAQRLWGDLYFDPESRLFRKAAPAAGAERTFVQFVLEPLYKIFSVVLGEERAAVEDLLHTFGVKLKPSVFKLDIKPLLQAVCGAVFGSAAGLTDMMLAHIPSTKRAARAKIERLYTGPQDAELMEHCKQCNPLGPTVVYIAKLFPRGDGAVFDAFGRVFSGSIKAGDRVRVLGESFSPDDEEDSAVEEVTGVCIYQARYRVPVPRAYAGAMVLIEGIDATISKTATVVPELWAEELHIFRPLQFTTSSVVKIATEPLNPSELPKMVEGLRKINKSYPLAVTRVEESGEHTILGTGEIYLDSLMKDLREIYADVEVKVADPVVTFCETVVETSSLKCFAETPNKRNKITMMAEPLEKGLAEDIEAGSVKLTWPRKQVREFFESKYGWDVLAVRSVWAFGPDTQGPNVLLDDTLSGEQDKTQLNAVRESIVQGFQWGVKEGPLCDEPIRSVKFKILDASIAPEALHRGGGQIIPTARRVLYSAFLLATPRLMEPIYFVEIMTPPDCVSAIYTILQKRRGHVIADVAKPGTPIFVLKAQVPVIESFGFETDIRYHTQGQAFCLSVFDHWAIVPGDPLDKSIVLRPLEPAPTNALAREFMVKTRRRKGMSEDVSINKFFDDPMLLELARQDVDLQALV